MSLIVPTIESELYKYMTAIITNNGHKVYVVNGMPDHIHILVSMNPKQSASDLMYEVKRSSSLWINERKLVVGKFSWQEGYGVFSYGKSQLPTILAYIEKQKQHHSKKNFTDEYKEFLKLFEIEYDNKYIYKEIE